MHGFVTSIGFEEALISELQITRAQIAARWPGLVACKDAPVSRGRAVDPVFARQQLPAATLIKGALHELPELAFAAIAPVIERDDRAFALHAFVPDPGAYGGLPPLARQVSDRLMDLLRTKLPRVFRRYVAWQTGFSGDSNLSVVQAALVGRTSLLLSVAGPKALGSGGTDLSPWPAGLPTVAEDRKAPSRAYRKLREGFAWLGCSPGQGESCVDLGGAPGGWAWTALAGGARVTAVDRSALAPSVMEHPDLTMIRGDAFAFVPSEPVDWLLCDVICEPERTVGLVLRWMEQRWCRRVVATLKFKGAPNHAMLNDTHRRLSAFGWRFLRMKHLFHHHNEVAILASQE